MGAIYRLMGDASAAVYGLLDGVITQPADTTAPAWTGSTITESAVTTTGCTVTWPTATDAGSVSYRWRVNGGAWTVTTATSATISGQVAGATITVDAQAFDGATPPNYNTTTLTKQIALQQPAPPPDTQAPVWPANPAIQITSLTTTSYTATAPAATDNSGAVTYRWTRGGAVQAGVTGAIYPRTGATPGSTESLAVVALDPSGNESSALSASVTLQPMPAGSDVLTLVQARAYLQSLGADVPDDMLEDALATVTTAVPAMQAAGYDAPTMRRVQRMAVALVAAPGGPRRVQSQGAPSGASRSFKYGDQDFSALRRSLRALDRAGTVAEIVGPDPVGVALLFVV